MKNLPKIIIVLGSTASGKTDLGLALAKKFDGEIVSADSRQVYKKMDIGTAKPHGAWRKICGAESFAVEGVPHYMMDIVAPKENFSLADYKERAIAVINSILGRGKLPIIVGGTGLYIWALVENLDIPKAAPNQELRKRFEKKSKAELVALLKKVDPESAKRIDLKNPRRVLRALEVFTFTGESFYKQRTKSKPLFNALQIGINMPKAELYKRIETRVDRQIADGLIEETKKLAEKYPWTLPSMSGIGYRQVGCYLRGEVTKDEAVEMLKKDTRNYAKRQTTWFKRDQRINWVSDPAEAEKLVRRFL
ncbi:MAG: tRNA (adenosine(37)-N6)-dimethylallyltransferase MiaA [Patescibacteria group bacterium]